MNTSSIVVRGSERILVENRADWIKATYGLQKCYCNSDGRYIFKGGAHKEASEYAKALITDAAPQKFVHNYAEVFSLCDGALKDRLEGVCSAIINVCSAQKLSVKCNASNCSLLHTMFEEYRAGSQNKDHQDQEVKFPNSARDFDVLFALACEKNDKIRHWPSAQKHVFMNHMFYTDYHPIPGYKLVLQGTCVSYSKEKKQMVYELIEGATKEQEEIFSNFYGVWCEMIPEMPSSSSAEEGTIQSGSDNNVLGRLLDNRFNKKENSKEDIDRRYELVKSDVVDKWFKPRYRTTIKGDPMYTQKLEHYYKLFEAYYRDNNASFTLKNITEKEFEECMRRENIAHFSRDDVYVSAKFCAEVSKGKKIPQRNYCEVAQHQIPGPSHAPQAKPSVARTVMATGPVISSDSLVTYTELPHLMHSKKSMIRGSNIPAATLLNINLGKKIDISSKLRPIYIDGPNVACSFGSGKTCNFRGIAIMIRLFYERGHREMKVILPAGRIEQKQGEGSPPMDDSEDVRGHLNDMDILIRAGDAQINHKTHNSYDDRLAITVASANHGVVVSNDRFRDLQNTKFCNDEILRIGFTFSGEDLVLPQDPGGQHGADLDEYLLMTERDLLLMAEKTRPPANLSVFVGNTKKPKKKKARVNQSAAPSHMSTPHYPGFASQAVGYPMGPAAAVAVPTASVSAGYISASPWEQPQHTSPSSFTFSPRGTVEFQPPGFNYQHAVTTMSTSPAMSPPPGYAYPPSQSQMVVVSSSVSSSVQAFPRTELTRLEKCNQLSEVFPNHGEIVKDVVGAASDSDSVEDLANKLIAMGF